jgi:hypothetical protein
MKNLKIHILLLCVINFVKAQDSTKALTHEIGFNTVALVKQLISNNPTSTLAQSPYTIFYNLYVKDKSGIRLGLGFNNFSTQTKIEGEAAPRKSTQNSFNFRAGFTNNFIKQNRITLNAFADVLYGQSKLESVNTSTMQSFPTGTITTTSTSSDKTSSVGGQVGVGIKYNLYKHLSIYAEVPVTFLSGTTTSDVLVVETQQPTQKTTSKSASTSISILVPTTIYLVLRF